MATEKKDLIMNLVRVMAMPIRISYRFARDHFLVFSSVVLILILYSSFPSLFAIMVSTSPILICTTLLLGLLLSYGEPNALRIQIKDDKKIQEVFPLNSRATANDFRTMNYGNFTMGDCAVDRPDIKEYAARGTLLGEESSKVVNQKEDALYVHGTQYKDSETITADISGNNEKEAVPYEQKLTQGGFHSEKLLRNREIHLQKGDEVSEELGTYGAFSAVDKVESGSLMYEIREGSLGLPWKRVNDHDLSGSESDRAESSSPDASMTKINKILNEFDHDPLLHEESPWPVPKIKDDTVAASLRSSLVDDSDDNRDDGVESLVGVEDEVQKQKADGSEAAVKWIADDQKKDLDLGYSDLERNDRLMNLIAKHQAKKSSSLDHSNLFDEVQKQKADGSEAVVKWTADDQKNIMDLGYSEVERDSRLRIVMAKRQAKKSMSIDHTNPIDVGDDWDLSRFRFDISPISAPRHNYFDNSNYSKEKNDFPPIPGSAPSLFVPRRNFFDILCDQEDENSNLLVSETQSNQGEQMTVPAREMILRRNETFSLGRRQSGKERCRSWLKPNFIEDQDGFSSYIFQRQFSDRGDSKVSTVPESDSVSSLVDPEYEKENEADAEEEDDMLIDVEEEDEHETKLHEDSLSNVVKNDSAQAFSALPVQEVSNDSLINEASYVAGQIGKAVAESSSRSMKEDSTASVTSYAVPIHYRVFAGSQSIDRTKSLESAGYESLWELQPDIRCMSSSNLLEGNTVHLNEKDPAYLDSSEEESDVVHPMNQRAAKVDDQILSELDGDFHPHSYLLIEPRTQTPEVRSISYDNASANSVSQVNYHKPNQEDSISIHQKITESGVAFTFGSFGDLEQTVYNTKQRVLPIGSVKEVNLQPLKNAAMDSSVSDYNIEMAISIKSDHESSETGTTSRQVEELPASKLIVSETHSELHVLDARPFDNMHLQSKQVSDATDDQASKATEIMEVRTVERYLGPDVPNEQYLNDDSLRYKESISKEADSEGDKKAKSRSKEEHHISTSNKVFKVVGSGPSVDPGSHQNGVFQPQTGDHTARAKMNAGAPTFTRPNKRGAQKVIQQWRRVSHALLQQNQDVEANAAAPFKVAGEETTSNTGSQQKMEVPSVDIPREEAISVMISPQQEIPNSVESPRDYKAITDQLLQQQEIPSVNIPLRGTPQTLTAALDYQQQEDVTEPDHMLVQSRQLQEEKETNENPTNDSSQSDILELPTCVVMENGLLMETEKDKEKSDPQQLQEENTKKKKKKKKKSSKNSRNYCFQCGEPDHQRDSCPLGAPVCYHCSQTGHGFKECPKKLQEEANNEIQKDTPLQKGIDS